MKHLLLQVTDNVVDQTATQSEGLSLFDLFQKGGFIMYPIALLSIISIYFFIERYLTIKKATKIDSNFMANIKDMITNGNIKGAKALCERNNSPFARMIEKGVTRIGRPLKNIEVGLESVGKLEIYKLEKTVFVLSTIAAIAPMFGFLGTVFGMIKTFYNICLNFQYKSLYLYRIIGFRSRKSS